MSEEKATTATTVIVPYLHALVEYYECPFCKKELKSIPEDDPNTTYIGSFKGDKVCDDCTDKIRKVCGIEIVKLLTTL